jgi:choline dehydrogenase-like flavoprotein
MDTFDYIIVGGGAAGCVLANRLSADPSCHVVMVEPGRDHNSKKAIVRIPLGMISFMMPAIAFLGGPKFMSWYETEPEPGLQGRRVALPRGRSTGGSTTVNGMIYIRGQREDYDHWRDLGNDGWGYDDLLPYFKRAETFEILNDPQATPGLKLGGHLVADQIDPAYHGTDGPLNIAPLRSVNPMCDVFLEAAKQAGYSYNADFNGARQSGFGYYWFTQKGGERMSAERAYLDPIRHRPNLTILSGRRVRRLLMEGKTIIGVETDGEDGRQDIMARREVILSAGAFISAQLLMLSGIGDPAELKRHGIDVRHALPGVGANLQDHLDVTLEYKAKSTAPYGISWKALPRNILHVLDWIFRKRGLFSSTTGEGGAFVSTMPDSDRPNIQLFFCTSVGNAQNAGSMFGHGFLMHVCELRPGSIGRLRLRDADPRSPPSIIYNFFRGASTMDALREGMKIARRIIGQNAFLPHLDREVTPGSDADSDGALEAYIRQHCGTLYHPVGTCSMGNGPDAVVDPRSLKVHGLEGLRVIDASVMPSIVSGNTMAATYCIAEKGADLVLGKGVYRSAGRQDFA